MRRAKHDNTAESTKLGVGQGRTRDNATHTVCDEVKAMGGRIFTQFAKPLAE